MSRFKLQQIIRLREMLRKWRRLSNNAKSIRSTSSLSTGEMVSGRTSKVPPGHLAVYVGEERARFVIKTSLLAHPLFKALLRKTEEEIGFHYEGGLTLPCEVSSFQHLLLLMQSNHASHNMMLLMMMMMHDHGPAEHADEAVQEKKLHREFLPFLRELLQVHVTDTSALFVNRCLARPPLTSLPQPVF